MPVIRPYKGTLSANKGVMRGGQVVVLDHNRPNIQEDEDARELGGGSIKEGPKRTARKTNRVGGAFLQGPRARQQQHAILSDDRASIKPCGDNSGDSRGAGLVPNHLKVPASLGKKKKNNNNIKLVLEIFILEGYHTQPQHVQLQSVYRAENARPPGRSRV
jgi:hypothetical protein